MAKEKDFTDLAVEEWLGEEGKPAETPPVDTPPETPPAETPPPAMEPPVNTPPVSVTPPETPPADTPDSLLKKFNEATGLNFENIDKVKEFAKRYPELEDQVKVLPDLISALEKLENPLSYFKDETAYKVAQLAKDAKYQGKENIIDGILRNDLSKLSDVKIIEIAAKLKSVDGVRNPLRAELRLLGVDPDDVLEKEVDDIDEDTQDILKIKANQYREELQGLGKDIKAPSFEGTTVQRLIEQKKAMEEDFRTKSTQLMPMAEAVVKEVKEIKMTDDFSFKLDLTPEQIKSYSEKITGLVLSGNYDIRTSDGKQEVFGAIMDMFKRDFFDQASKALASHIVSAKDEEARRKYGNEAPLQRHEPPPSSKEGEKDLFTIEAEKMVARGY